MMGAVKEGELDSRQLSVGKLIGLKRFYCPRGVLMRGGVSFHHRSKRNSEKTPHSRRIEKKIKLFVFEKSGFGGTPSLGSRRGVAGFKQPSDKYSNRLYISS